MSQPKYSTVLFDFDGCIAHSLPVWLKSFRQAFEELGIAISDRRIIDQAFHQWDASELGIPDKEAFKKRVYDHFIANLSEVVLQEYSKELLDNLKKWNVQTALVTSTLRPVINLVLPQLQCNNVFDTVITWEDTEENKPHPAPLLKAMKELRAKPKETMMIGDSEVDILAAQAAEVTSIWYYPQVNEFFYPDNQFAHRNPDYTIRHFRELLAMV